MNLKVGDKVKVIAGSSRGKEGKVLRVLRAEERVLVEGINMIKKHVKPNGQQAGSIVEKEAPIHISNVKLVEDKTRGDKKAKVEEKTVKKEKKVKTTKKTNEDVK